MHKDELARMVAAWQAANVLGGGAAVYYVDTVSGNDSNDGMSSTTAFATLFKAYDTMRTNDSGNGTIYVSSTQLNPVSIETLSGQPNYLTIDTGKPIIRGLNGQQWYMGIKQELYGSGWDVGTAPVYSRIFSGAPKRIFVIGLTDANGEILELVKNSTTPETPAQGEYGVVSNIMYVRLPSDQNPNDAEYTITYSRRDKSLVSSCELLTLRDCNFHFAQGVCLQCNDGFVVARNCEFKYGAVGVASSVNADRVDCYDCVSNAHTNDGYNGNAGTMNLYDCVGNYNGDEGASPHQSSIMNIVGGEYNGNGGGAMTAANSAELNVDGALMDANVGHGALYATSTFGSFINNTVTNTTLGSGSGKGFECTTSGTVVLSGNIFSGNATPEDTSCN